MVMETYLERRLVLIMEKLEIIAAFHILAGCEGFFQAAHDFASFAVLAGHGGLFKLF